MPFSGSKLKALRVARGLTQAELAHRAHVRERQIIRWENNQNVPRLGAVKELAHILGTSMDQLMDDENAEEDDADADSNWPATLAELLERRVHALVDERLKELSG